jgi:hypothetical protein
MAEDGFKKFIDGALDDLAKQGQSLLQKATGDDVPVVARTLTRLGELQIANLLTPDQVSANAQEAKALVNTLQLIAVQYQLTGVAEARSFVNALYTQLYLGLSTATVMLLSKV